MEYDILKIKEEEISLKAQAGSIVSTKKSNMERIGFRRFENNCIFQTSRLGEANLEQLLKESRLYGGPGSPQSLTFAKPHSEHRESQNLTESVLESYQATLDMLRSQFPKFIFSGECRFKNETVSLQSSYGLDLSSQGASVNWYFLYQRKGSGNMIDGYVSGRSGCDRIRESVKQHFVLLQDLSEVADFTPGKYPVLFIEETEIIKKLLESFHVNKYKESAALFSEKLGQKLFDDSVNLVDCGYDPDSAAFGFFDGEGTVRNDNLPLVKNGVFNSLISDLRNQKKYQVSSTGNGLRSYDRGVSLGFKGLRFSKGLKKWSEVIKDLPICVVASLTSGGESNDLGEYSSPIQAGYVFKNGELIGLLPQATVKTSVDRFLGRDLIAISSDGFTPDQSSACVISEMDVYLN